MGQNVVEPRLISEAELKVKTMDPGIDKHQSFDRIMMLYGEDIKRFI